MFIALRNFFDKERCPYKQFGVVRSHEYTLPYNRDYTDVKITGKFYIKKETVKYRYINPFFGTFKRSKYLGALHVNVEKDIGDSWEKNIFLIPHFFESDYQFIMDADKRYFKQLIER